MSRGRLCLVLHAHLPFVRHPEHPDFLEEHWLYEALTESYLPLLLSFEALAKDAVPFRLAMSVTPTLTAMLQDDLLRARYRGYLDSLIALAKKEVMRQRHQKKFKDVAEFYLHRFQAVRSLYLERLGEDVLGALRRHEEEGRLEILGSSATHAVLPLFQGTPSSVRAQVRTGLESHRRTFGRNPAGFWLPECAYYPGLDELLAAEGIRWFILETHGVVQGSTRTVYGPYAPISCPSGLAAFARDPESSRQVWSAREGYPGDPEYRDFYRDIGYDLPVEYLGRYIGPDRLRIATGIKYHRVTGRDVSRKETYVRPAAMARAAEHARHFVQCRREQVDRLAAGMDRKPVVVAPYDAELFGHWWFEGPEFLEQVLRTLAADPETVASATPSDYLVEYPRAQLSTPSASSWGEGGYFDTWVNDATASIYPDLHRAGAAMEELSFRRRGAEGAPRRCLDQAARELLLAQASDWPFILKAGTDVEYAGRRVHEHVERFDRLSGWAEAGALTPEDEKLLAEWEDRDRVFPWLEFEVFLPDRRWPGRLPREPRRVAFLSAEGTPFVKVGGLADVVGALPPALARSGLEVIVLLPGYGAIDRAKHGVRQILDGLTVPIGKREERFALAEAASPAPGVRVLLVDHPGYFGRPGVYLDPATGAEYPDAIERFIFFTRAALQALRALGEPIDVVHCHDYHTALAPAFLKKYFAADPVLGRAASVFTIHNLGYQGIASREAFALAGLDEPNPGTPFEHLGQVNFLKAGIVLSDKVSTVSETYAREICTDPKVGAGLEKFLAARGGDLTGILNGIDVDEWNPAADPRVPSHFDAEHLEGKAEAKRALRAEAGLDPARGGKPLLAIIGRLVDQKGIDLVADGLERILDLDADLVILGTGLPKYHEYLAQVAKFHPGRLAVLLRFDEGLAHRFEAGADAFLMPSLYEPCGLNQMYSLRYGTVPVVRATGGLADTVTDDDAAGGKGNGFSFVPYTTEAFLDAVGRALRAHADPARWTGIVRRAMAANNSWGASAGRYLDLYRDAMEKVG